MPPRIVWLLVPAAFGAAVLLAGWRGLALGVTVTVFWLVLQFNRSLRVMRRAAQSPVGHVDSAVMLASRLAVGMTLLEVVALTRSLGVAQGAPEAGQEAWQWVDGGGASVTLQFANGRVAGWLLQRPAEPDGAAPLDAPPAPDAVAVADRRPGPPPAGP